MTETTDKITIICPTCDETTYSGYVAAEGNVNKEPKEGDLTMCPHCGEPLIFDAPIRRDGPTSVREITNDEAWSLVRNMSFMKARMVIDIRNQMKSMLDSIEKDSDDEVTDTSSSRTLN